MSELKPCPFCGGTDSFVERADLSSSYVFCNECSARGPAEYADDDDEEIPGAANAIAIWNQRADRERRAQPAPGAVAWAATSEEVAAEALQRDAARYRWLRDQIVMGPLTIATADSWELHPWSGDAPDAPIDAAMAAQEGKS